MRISSAEFLALQLRLQARRGQSHESEHSAKASSNSEASLHQEILTECQRRQWLVLHGSMAHKTFRTLGEPDFVILQDGGRFLLVEAKTAKGKLTTEQRAFAMMAELLGHKVNVVRSLSQFLAICEAK